MPYNCCVYGCSGHSYKNQGELKFHSFPSGERGEEWKILIKTEKPVSRKTKICSRHFKKSDYIVTSQGNWKYLTKTAVPSLNLPKSSFQQERTPSNVRRENRDIQREKDSASTSTGVSNSSSDVSANVTIDLQQISTPEPFGVASASGSSSSTLEDAPEVLNSVEIQTESLEQERKDQLQDVVVQTLISGVHNQFVSFDFLDEKKVYHFTGFSRKNFAFLLSYITDGKNLRKSKLTMNDELFLTLCKYRLNMLDKTLVTLFDLDHGAPQKIYNFWTDLMYEKFKSLDMRVFKKKVEGKYDVIIDCTEMNIEKSLDPCIHQATFSNYKNTTTFKALIGCNEDGAVLFISDLYGGAISDREITLRSNFLDFVDEGDFVLANKGFDISDIFENKKVHLNIPPFKKSPQFSEREVLVTCKIANRRRIIERIIRLTKKNKILVDRMPVKLWPQCNKIVFNCFFLRNFCKAI